MAISFGRRMEGPVYFFGSIYFRFARLLWTSEASARVYLLLRVRVVVVYPQATLLGSTCRTISVIGGPQVRLYSFVPPCLRLVGVF